MDDAAAAEVRRPVRFVFRNYPLSNHEWATIAAKVAYAASLQGKFWEMHDLLYEKQGEWAASDDPRPYFDSYAESLGLDMDKFHADADAQSTTDFIKKQAAEGKKAGVTHTPWFVIDGAVGASAQPGAVREGHRGGAVSGGQDVAEEQRRRGKTRSGPRTPRTSPGTELHAPLGALALAALAYAGFVISTYLTIVHYRGYVSPCYVVQGCETVQTSKYSVILGVPVALLGALFFGLMFYLAVGLLRGRVGHAGPRVQGVRVPGRPGDRSRCSCCRRSSSRRSAPTASPLRSSCWPSGS